MLDLIELNDSQLEIKKNWSFNDSYESNAFLANFNNEDKVVKIIKNPDVIENKIKKIELLKERLENFKQVITADAFICKNGKIIGYMMPYIKGDRIYTPNFDSKQDNITFLKNLSEILKKLHDLNITVADFSNNIISLNCSQFYLIDHDNFSIDNLPFDAKTIYLRKYEKYIENIDKHFDDYMLNIYTISTFKQIALPFIYTLYIQAPSKFNFKDIEIKNIFEKTMHLNNFYNEDLIIDKIDNVKDLKKMKTRLF